tara:strand:- start:194 stop:1186 length:993 start_codon:yes stop_codon:yes gene_type:complete
MSYLGTPPQSGFITTAKQRVTSSTNAYVDLDHAISSIADVIVFVNFVKQDTTNLTLTTSTRITLGATLVSSDIVEIHYLGKAVNTQTPGTGTVTNDMLAGSIANSKLATDPTNASNLASGTVPTARLGSGTASSSTFLRGDSTFAEAGGGGFEFIKASRSTSSAAAVQLNDIISSDYDHYRVVGTCVPASDNQDFFINARTGTPTNDNYTGSNAYTWEYGARYRNTSGGGSYTNGSMTDTKWKFGDNVDADADSHYIAFDMMLYDWGTQIHTRCMWRGAMINNQDSSSGIHIGYGGGKLTSNINATGINFSFSGGNVAEHSVSVFGLKKA